MMSLYVLIGIVIILLVMRAIRDYDRGAIFDEDEYAPPAPLRWQIGWDDSDVDDSVFDEESEDLHVSREEDIHLLRRASDLAGDTDDYRTFVDAYFVALDELRGEQ